MTDPKDAGFIALSYLIVIAAVFLFYIYGLVYPYPCGNHPKNAEAKYVVQYWSHSDHCWKGWDYFPDKGLASSRLQEIRMNHANGVPLWETFDGSDARVAPIELPDEHKDIASPKP